MEFYYYCVTCNNYRRDAPPGTPFKPDQRMWCAMHKVELPKEVGREHLICNRFEHTDPRADEWQTVMAKFPNGELWTFEIYRPSRKFAVIEELPKVEPETGDRVDP